MENSTNKNFWQKFAKIYTAFMSKNDAAYIAICDSLNDFVDADKNVLELACGTGQITFRMSDKAAVWIATDYSENMVKEAERRKKQEVLTCEKYHVNYQIKTRKNMIHCYAMLPYFKELKGNFVKFAWLCRKPFWNNEYLLKQCSVSVV